MAEQFDNIFPVLSEAQLQWIKYALHIRITDHIDSHHESNDTLLTDFFYQKSRIFTELFFVGECANSSHNKVLWFVTSTGQSIMTENVFIF